MDKYIGRLLDNRYEILDVIGTGGGCVPGPLSPAQSAGGH